MRIEGTVEDIKEFFKGADIYAGVCNDSCDTCKRFDDCPVPAESEEIKPGMFNLAELSMLWEEDFENWQPDTLTLTELEAAIIKAITSNVLPRHMPIHDWNLPYAEACILAIRREIEKKFTHEIRLTNIIDSQGLPRVSGQFIRKGILIKPWVPPAERPDARGEHRNGQPRSGASTINCRICGFAEVKGIFNVDNWAAKDVCACCASNNFTPEASLSLRPWLKAINTNPGKEDNAAKHAMDEHVHTHNESKEERTCKICGVKSPLYITNKADLQAYRWPAQDMCQCCADTRKPKPEEKSSESQDIVQCTEHTPILKINDDASPLASGGSGGTSAGGGMHQGSVPVSTYKFPAIGDTQVHISLDEILIPAFEHERKLKNNYKTLFFTQIVGSQAVLSYMGTKLYVNREKVLQLPHPIPRGYFSKQKSGTPSNRVAAIRLYREYLAFSVIGTVQKDSSVRPSLSPAVQSDSDQIREIKPFVDMRKSKERLIIEEKPLKSDILIPGFKWDRQAEKQYKLLRFFESDDGKAMLNYVGSRTYVSKQNVLAIPFPIPRGSLKGFGTSPRTAIRMYREYLAVQEQNQKVAKSEQIADIPEQGPLKHEQNPEKACDKCGTDISDMKGRNLCDDCQHAVIEAEATRKKKLEEKAAINERRWEKKALEEKKSEEPGEKGKMSEKTQKLHDLVTGHKIGPGTKFGE